MRGCLSASPHSSRLFQFHNGVNFLLLDSSGLLPGVSLDSAPISSVHNLFTAIFSCGAALTTAASSPSNDLALIIYAGRVISAVAPAFVSECSPKEVRGRITGLFQITIAVGVMISYDRIPRYLASRNRSEAALANLAYLRRLLPTDDLVVGTSIFVDSLGRKLSLFISAMGMGIFFFIIGALLKESPPPAKSSVGVWEALAVCVPTTGSASLVGVGTAQPGAVAAEGRGSSGGPGTDA
ncbi:hypothetical protein B0H13DRAFT_2326076 [Mycena leptocephala]|nr:hypothetical protein B0H13DRAFT_2326076 [Mycena leptocephala]